MVVQKVVRAKDLYNELTPWFKDYGNVALRETCLERFARAVRGGYVNKGKKEERDEYNLGRGLFDVEK